MPQDKSKGHIAFVKNNGCGSWFEFYAYDGTVYRSNCGNVIDTVLTGVRMGGSMVAVGSAA